MHWVVGGATTCTNLPRRTCPRWVRCCSCIFFPFTCRGGRQCLGCHHLPPGEAGVFLPAYLPQAFFFPFHLPATAWVRISIPPLMMMRYQQTEQVGDNPMTPSYHSKPLCLGEAKFSSPFCIWKHFYQILFPSLCLSSLYLLYHFPSSSIIH